uniref:Exocyst complex component n=3 Tax=Meloidogyne incognita group TaxID=654580 RepID=A0A914KIZ6_MELIC
MKSIVSTEPSVNTCEDSKSSESSSANPEISAEQEFCLYELETLSDSSSIGLVLRAIYDTGSVHKFTRALDKRITHYDKSILRVCTHHYQGFLDSLKQLRGLKEKCAEIRKNAEETNQLVQEESRALLKRSSEIVRYRKLQRNANNAIQQISMCLPMLENYAQLEKLMEQKKYLQALKVLEDLEHNYLNQLHKYRFAHQFAKSTGPIRDQIRERSYSELTDFLENLMKSSERIGAEASKHVDEFYTKQQLCTISSKRSQACSVDPTLSRKQQSLDIKLSADGSVIKTNISTSNSSQNLQQQLANSTEKHQPINCRFDAYDKLDFGPVHRCCQIFNVLGDREKFEVYYRKQRFDQIQLILERHTYLSKENLNSINAFIPYLNTIIGFFIIEDRIAQMQSTLVTESHKEELWELTLCRITETITSHFGNCTNVDLIFEMKKLILLLSLTIKSYGYNPNPFYNLLQNFRDKYSEILIEKYTIKFKETLETDDCTPIETKNEEEYRQVISEFPIYRRGIDHEAFPRKFPFSRFVPLVYSLQAKAFITDCVRFMEDLQLSQSEVGDTVRRYCNVLFARWSDELKMFIGCQKRSLVQLIQITINMGYLERSCEFLERIISEAARNLSETDISNFSGGSGNLSALAFDDTAGHFVALKNQLFRDSRSEVEQLIDEAFREKVQAFLDNLNYDWELQHPTGVASNNISDMITFLTSTFINFTNLPNVLARHICMQACKFLAERLHSMLLSPKHKAISMGALEQFSLDVMQCELFAAQCPVPGFEDNALAITFAHLRQLLDLVMGPDWTTFFNERDASQQQRTENSVAAKYTRVKASNAAILLEKIVEYEKRNAGFFALNRGDRHKLYETILKKLRSFND